MDSDEDVPEKIVRIKRTTMRELLDKQGISTKKMDDEDEWFDDFKMCDNDLYVDTLKVCGKKKTGRWVRETLLSMKIPSTAFEVYYDSSDKVFEFTCYGNGHGVGMSQMGAQEMAEDGDSYRDILRHYYSGCRVR